MSKVEAAGIEPVCLDMEKVCAANNLSDPPEAPAALWLQKSGGSRHVLARRGKEVTTDFTCMPREVIDAWPTLPPHIREAVLTLVASATNV
jgi:hypothetical protein